MSDYLLELAQNPKARKLISALGLPLPLPVRVRRAEGPWREHMLEGKSVTIGGAEHGELSAVIAPVLAEAGATTWVVGSERAVASYRHAAEWLKPVQVLPPIAPALDRRTDTLLFDASGIKTPDALRSLYDFFQPWVSSLEDNGRIVIITRPPNTADTPQEAAAWTAVEGFCRSLAKEVGRRGVTANLVYLSRGAESRLSGLLRFLMSEHSAFITGQPLTVTESVRANSISSATRSLIGKVALVTGAARGIGAKTAELLAREGALVVCLDRPSEEIPATEVAASIGASVLSCDVTDASSASVVVRHFQEKYGGVDIVVHNAGVTRDKTLARMKPDAWDAVVRANLSAVVRISEALLAEQVLRDEGRIIVVSSIAGIAGNSGQTNYAAAKAGLNGLIRSLAPRVGPRGITANAVAPGFIETTMTEKMPAALREIARRMSALGQAGQPRDIAEAVVFLAMPFSDGLTGTVLRVCGGALIGA